MLLVNETGQAVSYSISGGGSADCGTIDVDGVADLPFYDNQQNVIVSFIPVVGAAFSTTFDTTNTGEQCKMALVAEAGSTAE